MAYRQQWGNTSKSASTTLTCGTPGTNWLAGSAVVVCLAMDNVAGTVSAADTQGNIYQVVDDVTNANGVRAVMLVAFNVAGNARPVITVTHPSATARAVRSVELTGVGRTPAIGPKNTGTGTASVNTTSNLATPLAAGMHVVGMCAWEGPNNDAAPTQPGWVQTVIADTGTTGAGADTNISVGGGVELQTTATARTYDPTLVTAARDSANIIATFYEQAVPVLSYDLYNNWPLNIGQHRDRSQRMTDARTTEGEGAHALIFRGRWNAYVGRIDLQNIPQRFAALHISVQSRGYPNWPDSNHVFLSFNGDRLANYSFQEHRGILATVAPVELIGLTGAIAAAGGDLQAPASSYGVGNTFIFDYSSPVKHKTLWCFFGLRMAVPGAVNAVAAGYNIWPNVAPIEMLSIWPENDSFMPPFEVAIWGVGRR